MLNVGIIGAGYFGAAHAKALAAAGTARLVASCRNNAEALEHFRLEFGGKAYLDYRDLLADPSVEAVVIAVPHHLHTEIALEAAKAGKHIMIEKPIAPTVAECRQILDAANSAGIVLMPGHTMRFTKPFLAAKSMIDSGEIGRMRFGSSRMIKLWQEPNRQAWHRDPQKGGGMLFTAGIHALDRLLALAGQKATHVSAITMTAFHDQEADDAALLLIRFGDNAAGQVTSIGYHDGAVISGDEFVCDAGTLRIDFTSGVSIGRNAKWTAMPDSFEDNIADQALVRQWQAFAHAVATNSAPPVTGEDGLHVVACIEAAFKASKERREIAIES